jgi:hypothetical protein
MLSRTLYRLLPLLAAAALAGCASNEFTLEADLPGDFALAGDARYSAQPDSPCASQADASITRRIFATPGHSERPYRVSYQVPLSIQSDGCKRLLSHVQIEMDGESDNDDQGGITPDIGFANLTISDHLTAGHAGMPKKGARIFDGRCRWLLPATAADSRALECRASDIAGSWFSGQPGGELQRNELPGRIVRLAIGMAPDVPATVAGQ